ncbi:MAG TPA: type II secretion system F family protein [Burkholderiaceae bacterium]|jgi:general secretion pathway protein F
MKFRARIFDKRNGLMEEVALEAGSREALQALVEAQGKLLLSARAPRWWDHLDGDAGKTSPEPMAASGASNWKSRLGRGDAMAKLDVAWWCRELRTLLTAGMTVVEAMETLNAQAMSAVLGQARARVHDVLVSRLREGLPLSAAMQASGAFPAILIAGVKASERTSNLVEALDDYLQYQEMLDRLRKQVLSAAIYPAVVVSLGGLIAVFLLVFVVPRFSQIYADLRGKTSWTTTLLLHVSGMLHDHGALCLAAVCMVLLSIVAAWRLGWVQSTVSAVALKIGPLQRQIDEFRLAKLYHSMALMFKGGYAFDEALGQCLDLGLGWRIRAGVGMAQAALARGQRVSTALGDAGLTDTVSRRLLAVGERTGNFDRVLQTIAQRHAGNFSTFVERATRVVEPLLLLSVALFVGGIVIMMYMPVFDIASSIR